MTDTQNETVKNTVILTQLPYVAGSNDDLIFKCTGYLNGNEDRCIIVRWEVDRPDSDDLSSMVSDWDKPTSVYDQDTGKQLPDYVLIGADETDKISAYLEQISSEMTQGEEVSQAKTISSYAIGDLINGDTEKFENFYKAQKAYKEMFADGIRSETASQVDTGRTDEEIQKEASDHFYFHHITERYDADGYPDEVERVDVECGYAPVETITVSSCVPGDIDDIIKMRNLDPDDIEAIMVDDHILGSVDVIIDIECEGESYSLIYQKNKFNADISIYMECDDAERYINDVFGVDRDDDGKQWAELNAKFYDVAAEAYNNELDKIEAKLIRDQAASTEIIVARPRSRAEQEHADLMDMISDKPSSKPLSVLDKNFEKHYEKNKAAQQEIGLERS